VTATSQPWFRDGELLRQLPFGYRAYALHSRMAERTGVARGGGFLFRTIGRLYDVVGHEPIVGARVGDSTLYVDFRDRRAFWALNELRVETPETRVLRSMLGPGDTFIDVGANHGSFSLLAASLIGDSGQVFAFEPQPRLATLTARSLAASGTTRFKVFNVACGDHRGDVDLHVPWMLNDGSGSASVYAGYAREHSSVISVGVRPLDDVLDHRAISGRVVVKIDVEGSELAVLRGAQSLIADRRPAILFEVNPRAAREAGYEPRDIITFLAQSGYSRFAELLDFPVAIAAGRVANLDDPSYQRNLLALPDSWS
jgi:FkbM family methyltransferase